MTGSLTPHSGTPPSGGAPRPQWPRVIGTIGILLGTIMCLDKIDDLATLNWTEADWRSVFVPSIAELIVRVSPPVGLRLLDAVVQTGLGVFLIVASVALRRRRRAGVSLCRVWAWLAIAWGVTAMGWASWWLARQAGEIAGLSPARWQAWAVLGIGLALVLILAFPVFLLLWFSKLDVRAEVEAWPD